MGLIALNKNIARAVQDRQVSAAEGENILDRTVLITRDAPSLGSRVGRGEYDSLVKLQRQIATGSIQADVGFSMNLDRLLVTQQPYPQGTERDYAITHGVAGSFVTSLGLAILGLYGGISFRKGVAVALTTGATVGLTDYIVNNRADDD